MFQHTTDKKQGKIDKKERKAKGYQFTATHYHRDHYDYHSRCCYLYLTKE